MAEHLSISINEYKKIEYGHIPKNVYLHGDLPPAGIGADGLLARNIAEKAALTRKNGRMKQESNR